jgi:hypothetical protein
MTTPLAIKGIRKWRVTYDDLNWVIQQYKTGRQPPNDWVNKYYYTSLESCMMALLKLGVAEEKLTDFKKVVNAYNIKSKLILDAIRTLGEHFSLQPPESTRIKKVKKAIQKSPPTKKKKGSKNDKNMVHK